MLFERLDSRIHVLDIAPVVEASVQLGYREDGGPGIDVARETLVRPGATEDVSPP